MPPRGVLLAACLLLLCAAFCLPSPALGSSLLLGSGGFVLSRPLLLQGADVGAVLSALQADVAELKLKNAQLQGDLTVATQQITELQGTVAELQDTVTTQGVQLTDLNARLSAAESLSGSPTSALYTTVTGLQSNVSAHGTRLTTAEGGLSDLAIRVAAAENLDGVPTLLTDTVKAMRDLTGNSTLVTTVLGLRDGTGNSTLVTTLTNLRNGTDSSSALIQSLPCYGESANNTWKVYYTSQSPALRIDVSMAACGFSTPPQHVSASLYGNNKQFMTVGASSVYLLTATSFRVYILPLVVTDGNILNMTRTPEDVAALNWRINWMATR